MAGIRWTEEELEKFLERVAENTSFTLTPATEHAPRETKLAREDIKQGKPRIKNAEHLTQKALFERAALQLLPYPELEWLHAVPNGGFRDPATAAKLKAEGVKTGVLDLCLPVPRGGFHGLYLELKTPAGMTTSAQNRCIRFLRDQGYCVQIFDDWYTAWEFIIDYLEEDLQ